MILVKKLRSFIQNKKNQSLLKNNNFKIIKTLGFGKDGASYLCTKNELLCCAKVLSDYALKYLPLFLAFKSKEIRHPTLFKPELIDGILFYAQDDELEPISTEAKDFFLYFLQIVDLEIELLKHGILFWDFGFDHLNYMVDKNKQVKWIDYGGNNILFLDKKLAPLIDTPRKNLVNAKNEFVKLSLLTHISIFVFGQKTLQKVITQVQDNEGSQAPLQEKISIYFQNTSIESLHKIIWESNLLEKEGWEAVANHIKNNILTQQYIALDKIELLNVKYGDIVKVRGYQNYDLKKTFLLAYGAGHEWAKSDKKLELVKKVLHEHRPKSYLDIGCNLGMYVFFASITYRIHACGVDYNHEYIETCQKIAKSLNLINVNFEVKSLSDVQGQYEVVSLLGVIHHLFNRTEDFGNFESIFKKLSQINTKFLIIEFPTEKDSKAEKWTKIPGRSHTDVYNLKNFLSISKHYYPERKLLGYAAKHRPIYLFIK